MCLSTSRQVKHELRNLLTRTYTAWAHYRIYYWKSYNSDLTLQWTNVIYKSSTEAHETILILLWHHAFWLYSKTDPSFSSVAEALVEQCLKSPQTQASWIHHPMDIHKHSQCLAPECPEVVLTVTAGDKCPHTNLVSSQHDRPLCCSFSLLLGTG